MEEEKVITEQVIEGQPEEKLTKERIREIADERRRRQNEAVEAIASGKGVLKLEKPIPCDDDEIEELEYDFTALTGMEYIDAMDMDTSAATNIFRSTNKQNLALFAQAAAKQTPGLDMRDIMERIGITDAVEGAQLAALFFNASTRAGQLRISKRL